MSWLVHEMAPGTTPQSLRLLAIEMSAVAERTRHAAVAAELRRTAVRFLQRAAALEAAGAATPQYRKTG